MSRSHQYSRISRIADQVEREERDKRVGRAAQALIDTYALPGEPDEEARKQVRDALFTQLGVEVQRTQRKRKPAVELRGSEDLQEAAADWQLELRSPQRNLGGNQR